MSLKKLGLLGLGVFGLVKLSESRTDADTGMEGIGAIAALVSGTEFELGTSHLPEIVVTSTGGVVDVDVELTVGGESLGIMPVTLPYMDSVAVGGFGDFSTILDPREFGNYDVGISVRESGSGTELFSDSTTILVSGVTVGWSPWIYDLDGDGDISPSFASSEYLMAFADESNGYITPEQLDEVFILMQQTIAPVVSDVGLTWSS